MKRPLVTLVALSSLVACSDLSSTSQPVTTLSTSQLENIRSTVPQIVDLSTLQISPHLSNYVNRR